jgi:hypothetical protein
VRAPVRAARPVEGRGPERDRRAVHAGPRTRTLGPCPADVAVLSLEAGRFVFADVKGAEHRGTQKLACELTLREGKVVWDPRGRSR